MKRWVLARKRSLSFVLAGTVVVVSALVLGFKISDADYFFKLNKSIDLFGRVYREVTMNYVDEVDPEKFMESGIDGLLSTLDPYTNYISESEGDEVELITVGKYGGIGVTVGLRDGYITILTLMEGYSAQRQGLLPGDRILEIDGKTITGTKPENVRTLTRGEPGTTVHMKIEREGERKPMEFDVVREEIQLKNLSYADFVSDGIAYIHIDRFSRGAGDELRLAMKDLKFKASVKGMILDLRDNPGGLLDVAVDVVEKFAPKGSLVVSTRGRKPESERKFYVTEEPMLPDVPLVVLVNRGSASASEIVAGAIQDLDRGVILGTRTFGKGLVQTITPLVYGAQLKITTAKYYTPSGRCIQEIDYMHKNKDGIFATMPDSLRHVFKTLKGRPEFEAGGITPDSVVGEGVHSNFFTELARKSMFFKYATRYASEHKDTIGMGSPDRLLADFGTFLSDQQFHYLDEGEAKLNELSEIVDKGKYSPTVHQELEALRKMIQSDKSSGLDRHQDEVYFALRAELISRYYGERGRIEALLQNDPQVKSAVGVLNNTNSYAELLSAR